MSRFKVHEIAGALKKYLRESFSLIPDASLPKVLETHNGDSVSESALWSLLDSLPSESKEALQDLTPFLFSISCHSSVNLMGLENLAIVFCPILLREAPSFDLSRTSMLSDISLQIIRYALVCTSPTDMKGGLTFSSQKLIPEAKEAEFRDEPVPVNTLISAPSSDFLLLPPPLPPCDSVSHPPEVMLLPQEPPTTERLEIIRKELSSPLLKTKTKGIRSIHSLLQGEYFQFS